MNAKERFERLSYSVQP